MISPSLLLSEKTCLRRTDFPPAPARPEILPPTHLNLPTTGRASKAIPQLVADRMAERGMPRGNHAVAVKALAVGGGIGQNGKPFSWIIG